VLLTPTEQISQLISSLTQRADATGERQLVGIIGAPGTGKTTFAEYVANQLPAGSCVIVPMDGFHLANAILEGSPLRNRKGAIDTFDAHGYVSLLERIRRGTEDVVYAPSYRRGLEEPIAASIAVPATTRYVITEGNYLLSPNAPWNRIPELLDETWFVEVSQEVRIERLIARHEQYGMTHAEAVAWANTTDEVNARFVETTKSRADQTVKWW
jgi:pantothenate kinase